MVIFDPEDIRKCYEDVARLHSDMLSSVTAARMWLLTNVATRMGCGITTVRNAVPMIVHKKIVKKYIVS